MSGLRQRPVSLDTHSKSDLGSFKSEPKPPKPGPTARWPILLGAALVSGLFLGWKQLLRTPVAAPSSYAVCSPNAGGVYAVDASNTRNQCIVVKGALIHDVGSLEAVKARWHTSSAGSPLAVKFIDPKAIIVPGLSDSHAHILEYGASKQLPLEGTKTIQDTVARVREYILSHPDVQGDKSKFILGGGWDHTVWPSSQWPSADDLEADPVVRGRPIVLQSKDCHALWVSSKALEVSLPFPESVEGGVIVRNSSGFPTGMLLDNAQELVKQPPLTDADLQKRFDITVQAALANGLTSIHDAGLDPMSLKFFTQLSKRTTIPVSRSTLHHRLAHLAATQIRIYGMRFFDEAGEYWGNTTTPIIAPPTGRLTARSVKIFADGALRTGGAALYEPYSDNPTTKGFMRLDEQVLFKFIPLFLRDGWQVNVHAIGDRANGIVIDAFEASLKGANVTALRPRLEHAQIITRPDMIRLGKLGVIASVQPTHAISDMWYAQDRLGPERVKNLYAFRTLIDSGARITLGSDAPVETINPLSAFYSAVTRLSHQGDSPHGPGGWFPEQRLTRAEALRGMTIDPAFASFTEDMLGSLEPGKRADFVILSQDIMTVPETEILQTKVIATVIDGRAAYGDI